MKKFLAVIAILMFLATASFGATIAPMPKLQFLNNSGAVLSGGKIYTYVPGSTTPITTYTDTGAGTPNANPVVTDVYGRASIFLSACTKFVVKTSADVTLYTVDNICPYATETATFLQWQESDLTPTYISGTSMSFTGDQTGTFEAGLRIRSTNTGGVVYSTISSASYGAGITTLVVVNDSSTLDSGLSAVSYSILTVSNPSAPIQPVVTKTGGYTILPTDCGKTFISNISSAATFTFPAASAVPSGCKIVTKNTSTYTLTLGVTLDGQANPLINVQNEGFVLFSDGTAWKSVHVWQAKNATLATVATTATTAIKSNELSFEATLSADQTVGGTPEKINFNTETFDTNNNYDNATNYRFTPTVAGKYLLILKARVTAGTSISGGNVLLIYKNGSQYIGTPMYSEYGVTVAVSGLLPVIVDANGSTDYFEGWINAAGTGTLTVQSNTAGSTVAARFSGVRVGN